MKTTNGIYKMNCTNKLIVIVRGEKVKQQLYYEIFLYIKNCALLFHLIATIIIFAIE